MLERRIARRRRVCLEGRLASGLTGPIAAVRVRNLSPGGAEIVGPDGGLAGPEVELHVEQAGVARSGRVVWRRMERFGIAFAPLPTDVAAPRAEAPDGPLAAFLRDERGR